MSTIDTLDCRGLSCPQPPMLTRQTLKKKENGILEVLVDSGTARENVARVAQSAGWQVTVEELTDGVFKLVLKK